MAMQRKKQGMARERKGSFSPFFHVMEGDERNRMLGESRERRRGGEEIGPVRGKRARRKEEDGSCYEII